MYTHIHVCIMLCCIMLQKLAFKGSPAPLRCARSPKYRYTITLTLHMYAIIYMITYMYTHIHVCIMLSYIMLQKLALEGSPRHFAALVHQSIVTHKHTYIQVLKYVSRVFHFLICCNVILLLHHVDILFFFHQIIIYYML